MPAETQPTHVAGFTIQTPIEFGVFGRCYVGFHSQEGRRILKILRTGEELSLTDEEHAKLKDDPTLLHFEPRQQTPEGQRILFAHFFQAASMGILIQGSPLQKGCDKTLAELDPNNECSKMLRDTTLQQKLELVRTIAQRVEKLHAEKKSFPFLTPWNLMLSDAQPKFVDIGLNFAPDKLDLDSIPEDVLAYFAPEVVKCLVDRKPVQVSPAADVYALALTARSILLEHVVDIEGAGGAPAPAPGAAPGSAAPAPASGGKRAALMAGKSWKRAPQEKISNRLEGVLARAASPDPRRRPPVSGFVKEIESILRDRAIAWTAPSKVPQIAGGLVLVLAIGAGVTLAVLPDAAETTAHKKYAAATRESDLGKRDALAKEGEDALTKKQKEITLELRKLDAIDALAAASKNPDAAVKALRDFADKASASDCDGLTARFIAAFVNKWALLNAKESTDELTKVANASGSDSGIQVLATLSKIALRIGPMGVEGADLKPDTSAAGGLSGDSLKAWLDVCRSAQSDSQSPLVRFWAIPSAYEHDRDPPAQLTYKAGWIAQLLGGRVVDLRGENAAADIKAGADALPCFGTSSALALHLARNAKTADEVTAASNALDAASKLKKEGQVFGEGSLAHADLLSKSARLAADSGKNDAAKWRDAVKAYGDARSDKAVTPGLDVAAAAERGRLLAKRELGIAIARDPASAANTAALKEAEAALSDVLGAFEKDKDFQDKLAPDAHEALGLVLMVQPARLPESYNELASFYVDWNDVKNLAYRKADDPANKDVSTAFFNSCKAQLLALLAPDAKPDPDKHAQLHDRITALCKLEKFDTSFLTLADAQAHRKEADAYKAGDKKRLAALNTARGIFQGVFSGSDTSWTDGLSGFVECTLTIAHESPDPQVAGKALGEGQTFLDGAADALKQRKLLVKDAQKTIDAAKATVRKAWFDVCAKWLAARGDPPSTDLSSSDQDLAFVQQLIAVAEGSGTSLADMEPASRSLIAQVHWVLGKFEYDQKKWTEAVKDLGLAVDGLGDDKTALKSQATQYAAEIALQKAGDVRPDGAPWGASAGAAAAWARDVLSKRLGAESYQQFRNLVKQGKNKIITDENAAKMLADSILNDPRCTPDDVALATQIYTKSARAQLQLAKGNVQSAPDKVREAAKKAVDMADPDKEADILIEAANLFCDSTPDSDFTKGATELGNLGQVVNKAVATYGKASEKWRGTDRAADAFSPLYWQGRYMQAMADLHAGSGQDARTEYKKALDAYNKYRDELKNASLSGKERPDTQNNINTCSFLANKQ